MQNPPNGPMPAQAVLLALLCSLFSSGCVYEFEARTPRAHGTVGHEVFRVLCHRLAAQAYPEDTSGVAFEPHCDGTATGAYSATAPEGPERTRHQSRLNALVARRADLVAAMDHVFESDSFADGELHNFLQVLVPLYDPPEILPEATRAGAALMANLSSLDDAEGAAAIEALSRMGAREGYRKLSIAVGMASSLMSYPRLDELVVHGLGALAPDGVARKQWEEVLLAAALDLGTADPTPAGPNGTLAVTRDLLLADNATFSAGQPIHLVRRDARGLAIPTLIGAAPIAPFMDADADGLADSDPSGTLTLSDPSSRSPYKTLRGQAAQRDPHGRALSEASTVDLCAATPADGRCGRPCETDRDCGDNLLCDPTAGCVGSTTPNLLYQHHDLDRSVLATLLRDIGPFLDGTAEEPAPVQGLTRGLMAVLGEWGPRDQNFSAISLSYEGPDTSKGPLFDLVHALSGLLEMPQTDRLLQIVDIALRDHESELAGLIDAMLYIDERADLYPDARLEGPHDFWDGMIALGQRILQRPGMLEAVLRSMATDEFARSGALFGNFMRFKDRVVYPMGRLEELSAIGASGIDMKDVVAGVSADPPEAALADLIQEHRENVNFPCPPLPRALDADPVEDCTPIAPLPAAQHRGIRTCPDSLPTDGSSCADMRGMNDDIPGFGLCSYDAGACSCDCAGGLCRGGAEPTWRCGLPSTQGYSLFVDRAQPDSRLSADGQTNQSLFQRTAALVHDLHVPAALCNKEGASMKLFDPAGGAEESGLAGILPTLLQVLGFPATTLGPHPECGMLDEPQIVRFFAQAILGRAELSLSNDDLRGVLDTLETLPPILTSLAQGIGLPLNPNALARNEVMQRQSQIRGLFIGGIDGNGELVPGPRPGAVARMVFAPFNPFEGGMLALPTSRDGIDVVDLHRDTIFAWEVPDPVAGLSYYEALTPLVTALEDNELVDDEDTLLDGYIFGDLITQLHLHWGSRAGDGSVRACTEGSSPLECETSTEQFGYQSNIVSYEELLGDAFVDARITERIQQAVVALDGIELADGSDGIDALVGAVEATLDPAVFCGESCIEGSLTRRDGSTGSSTETGAVLDVLTPLHRILDALNAIDAAFEGDQEPRLGPWRGARSSLVDILVDTELTTAADGSAGWQLKNRRSAALLREVIAFTRARLQHYGLGGSDCPADGTTACEAVRTWTSGLAPRMERSLAQPIGAAALRLLDSLWMAPGDPGGEITRVLAHLIHTADADPTFETTLVSAADLLQVLDDTTNTAPLMTYLARGVAPNVHAALAAPGQSLSLSEGAVERTLALLRSIAMLDPGSQVDPSTLAKISRKLLEPFGPQGESPLEVFIDAIAEVNRAAPAVNGGQVLGAEDLRSMLGETASFLGDERHGLERLFDIIQARKLQ